MRGDALGQDIPESNSSGWLRQLLFLIRQEVREGGRLWAVSLVVGLLPFLAPLLPSLSRFSAFEVREAMASVLGGFFDVVFLIVLGSGFMARDLVEGRLGFFYSRPLAGGTLGIGKLLGAWVVALGCQILLFPGLWLIPWLEGRPLRLLGKGSLQPFVLWADQYFPLMASEELPTPLPWPGVLIVCGLAVLAILLLIHALTVWLRARSAWLWLDGLAMTACGALCLATVRRLEGVQAFGTMARLERLGFVVLLAALVLALWVQVSQGRTHLVRAHRSFSVTLWPLLLLAALAADGYSRFVVSPEVDDLVRLRYVESSPDNSWVFLGGPTQFGGGAMAALLLDYEEHREWYLGGLDITVSWLAFSADGSRLAWIRCERLSLPMACEVWSKDLLDKPQPPQPSGIRYDVYPDALALSPDGQRLAVARGYHLEILDVATARLVSSQRLDMHIEEVSFLSPYRLRLSGFLTGPREKSTTEMSLAEVDIEGNRFDVTWDLPNHISASRAHRREDMDLLFYQTLVPPKIALVDAVSGDVKFEQPAERLYTSRFLDDGRLVLVAHDESSKRLELKVIAPSGEELLQLERLNVEEFSLGGEWSQGRLWLGLDHGSPQTTSDALTTTGLSPLEGWVLYSLQGETGELRPVEEGLRPLFLRHMNLSARDAAVGSPATRLFVAAEGSIVWWEPETRRGHVVFQPKR